MSDLRDSTDSLSAAGISGPETVKMLGLTGFSQMEVGNSETESYLKEVDHLIECVSIN